jgi:putative cell wall-binding protein
MQGFGYERIWGSDRYATNWQIISRRYDESQQLRPILASGENFPDALVIGAYAGRQDRPILLVGKTRSTKSLRPWVYSHRDDTLDVDVVGGPASVSAYISQMFEKWRMNRH